MSGQFSTALCFASKNFSECLGPNNVLKRACLQLWPLEEFHSRFGLEKRQPHSWGEGPGENEIGSRGGSSSHGQSFCLQQAGGVQSMIGFEGSCVTPLSMLLFHKCFFFGIPTTSGLVLAQATSNEQLPSPAKPQSHTQTLKQENCCTSTVAVFLAIWVRN